MKDFNNLDDLKAEFDKFVTERCINEEQKQVDEEEDNNEETPAFVDE